MTTERIISADASIDLQTHTVLSDGVWIPEQLIQHFVTESFALAAITDHDRVDTAKQLQKLAHDHDFHLLVATEMTTQWRGDMVDILCYGFDLDAPYLDDLTQDILQRQQQNTRQVYDYLHKTGHVPEFDDDQLNRILMTPSAQHLNELLKLVDPQKPIGEIFRSAGFSFATHDTAKVVDAAHQSGAVALIAHPGRGDGFAKFDAELLDAFRKEIPIDGLEAYYPLHTSEQTAMFQAYADKHNLLVSSGSDSHSPEKPPIQYPASLSQKLLERLDIRVTKA